MDQSDQQEESGLTEELERAEGLLVQGEDELAVELLAHLAEDVEEYVDKNCITTDEVQWFSFPTLFERLAYRRVENDPRELRDVGEPFSRLYADLGYACVCTDDYASAAAALKQAVRWNPMDCASRLNLADLYRIDGNVQEYLALTYSVFERASDARHLARAYTNFAGWFQSNEKPRTAAAALRAARRLDVRDSSVQAVLDEASGTDHDPDRVNDKQMEELLAEEGLPAGANAEIAVCLLMCAIDAYDAQDQYTAANLMVRARDLVGEPAMKALLELIRTTDDGSGGEGDSDASAGA